MDFVSNQEAQNREMLQAIGVASLDELFASIPKILQLSPPSYDDGLSEYEGLQLMESLATKNTFPQYDSYLGAGAYSHYVPALVGAICSKSEFLTSYTPYQAEASQGMLQIIFEYQSAICALTGMDVSNASLYDGASACAEAALMALRHNRDRNKILISESLHPHYQEVVNQYLCSHSTQIELIPFKPDGTLDRTFLEKHLDDKVAAVLLQSPNFFGVVEDFKEENKQIKAFGALSILCANPLAFGLYASAAEQGADIAVGDCQPFGISLQFGGPYVGYIACRQDLVRQLPGRIVGETVDEQGRRGFVLTLQAREQHIRREKATSNICTNQALSALAALVGILWYGRKGIPKLALTNYQRTAYLRDQLRILPGISLMENAPFFNEFCVSFSKPVLAVQEHFRSRGIEPGLNLEVYYPSLKNYLLVAVTETKSKDQLDKYLNCAKELELGAYE